VIPLYLLVTRPPPAGKVLCDLIEARGDVAIHLPTIAFAPPADEHRLQRAIARLGEQDWLIFISPQAVYASIPAIRSNWPDFPPQVKLAAVGKGTAAALKAAGYLVTVYPSTQWSSEGLLALPTFQSLHNQKIAIIRGDPGREQLERELTARGAQVTPVIAYQRQLPVVNLTPYLAMLAQKKIDAIIAASGEGVQNLKKMFHEQGWDQLKQLPLIVISERIKWLAHELGFQTIWITSNASHEAILAVIEQKRNELCQIK